MTGAPTLAAPLVDDPPQGLEETGDSVDLVEDHETVGIVIAVLVNVRQLRAIPRILQVEVCGVPFPGELKSERGLADLARSGEDHGGGAGQTGDRRGPSLPVGSRNSAVHDPDGRGAGGGLPLPTCPGGQALNST